MRLRLASIEARKRAERRARNTATKRAVREVVPPEQRRKNLKKLHKRYAVCTLLYFIDSFGAFSASAFNQVNYILDLFLFVYIRPPILINIT